MILDLLVKAVVTIFTGLLGLVPAYSPDSTFSTAGASLGATVSAANGVFPVVTLGACIGALVLARLFLVGWELVVFIYDRIPGKFT